MDLDLIKKKIKEKNIVAGFDEVGAGVLCGDLVVAGVIMDENNPVLGLMDSKKISEKKRAFLSGEIKEKCIAYSIIKISPKEIDKINIFQARMLAFKMAADELNNKVGLDYAIIDGNKIPQDMVCDADCVVKGDNLFECISAASIIAKHERDSDIIKLSKEDLYSVYGLENHKGYGTKKHMEMLNEYGFIEGFYRESYKPIKLLRELGKIRN